MMNSNRPISTLLLITSVSSECQYRSDWTYRTDTDYHHLKVNIMPEARGLSRLLLIILLLLPLATNTRAQAELSPEIRARIDKLATDALARSGVPSASIAVVKEGKIVYLNAYGSARLEPKTPATTQMRYSIG